ncbi:hypothetical protein JCM6882_008120 [Rhodosporidiobolus microsporus]
MTDSPALEAPAEPPKATNGNTSSEAPPPAASPDTHLSPPTPSPTASYMSSAAVTPSVGYDSSAPPTPYEFPANDGVGNPSLALDTPARELGNLSLASTPESHSAGGGSPHLVQGVGADAHRLSDHPGSKDHHAKLAEGVLARTSAGQQALKEGAALPSLKGLAVPGPSTPSGAPSTAAGTPNLVSSTAVTPGTSRIGTPQIGGPEPAQQREADKTKEKEKDKGLMPPPASSAHGRRPGMDGKTDGAPVKEGKKSVFGKLFDRDRNSSTASFASQGGASSSSAAMERRGSGSGGVGAGGAGNASDPHAGAHINGLAPPGSGTSSPNLGGGGGGTSTPPLLARRQSAGGGGKRDKDAEKAEKEREKREKQERKEREKREKEEQKEREKEAGRARSASRGRTPSQTGRPRSDSKGEHHHHQEKKGALDGAMDFMRIKVQRKTSVTSRRSDDGRSEKSVYLGGGGDGEGRSQYGGSTKEETKSRGGQSNGSLSKKYGVCDKVIVGKGATAVVRLAHKWDRSTEKLYAVKEFRKRRKNETEKEYVKKLTSEFCISSTLHHHNVVETVDLVQDEQQHWCEVMEYCPGGDLYAVIKKGDLGPAEINSFFAQILAGVAYLHSMGVAHRDIKPENLLLDAKGHVKITDFGVSDVFRMCWEKTTHLSKGLCGSEPYIAPEQFEHKEYDARLVDVWACAVVFYCMHFSELPWRVAKHSDPSFGPYAQAYKTSTSTPAPLSNLVPRECRAVIRRMLDPDPATRATTDEVMATAWFKTIEVLPPLPSSTS